MKFFIATKNQHKYREFTKIFENLGHSLICESDLETQMPDVVEDGTSFEENALIKARTGVLFSQLPCVSDDSGICVDYLNGAPGIFSARYAGEHGDDKANNQKLLAELNGVPYEKRTGRYVCAIACVFPDGREFTVRGEVEGIIAESEKGSNGFGYDPLFISEIGRFSEVSAEAKNEISHRGIAIKKFTEEVKKYL